MVAVAIGGSFSRRRISFGLKTPISLPIRYASKRESRMPAAVGGTTNLRQWVTLLGSNGAAIGCMAAPDTAGAFDAGGTGAVEVAVLSTL
jgi:hypothetical protein